MNKKSKKATRESLTRDPKPVKKEDFTPVYFKSLNGENGYLSNFYRAMIKTEIGDTYTSENYFQAMKFMGEDNTEFDKKYAMIIMNADSPMKAKMLGTMKVDGRFGKNWLVNKDNHRVKVNDIINEYKDKVFLRKDWNEVKISVMIDAVYYKFIQNKDLMKKLVSNNDNVLFMENTKDKIWGIGLDGTGTNYLGKILTALMLVLKGKDCNKSYLIIN